MTGTSGSTGASGFRGFTPDALQFLADLAVNNDRAWFTPRKAEYERLLKEPMAALCTALAGSFERSGVPLLADPRRSPFRIHRDTRFSKDKSPYKTAASASFGWNGPSGVAGGGYFHLQPGEIFVGGGMWHPEPPRLAAFRRLVDADPERVLAALEDASFAKEFGAVGGERLTRIPKGYAKDHPQAELLKLKDVTFSRRLSDAEVFSPALPETLARSLAQAAPVFALLASLDA